MMTEPAKVLAVITAGGGSKGVPRNNIRLVCVDVGRQLRAIGWKIT
jgi:CMP-N-acetylneuraminic acid synthetase